MPTLALGIPFNLFWATTADAVATIEREADASGQPVGDLSAITSDWATFSRMVPDGHGTFLSSKASALLARCGLERAFESPDRRRSTGSTIRDSARTREAPSG